MVSQPDTGEQALEITEALVRSGAIDVIVVDSVAALVPRAEIEGEMGDSHVGLQARLMSQALRKLAGAISKSNCVAIFINQLREKVGVIYGSPEVTPGGRALKFYSSVRIDIRRTETLKNGTEQIGSRTRAKVVKNKVAPPFREAEFDGGSWFSYGETRLGQGRDNVKEFLLANKEIYDKIEEEVKANVGKLYAKSTRGAAKAVAKPVVTEPEKPGTPTTRIASKANIDITVDD